MYPDRRVAVLVLSDADRLAGLAALTADLEASSSFSVEVTSDLERLRALDSVHALFADWRGPRLTTDPERNLVDFVRGGGAGVGPGGPPPPGGGKPNRLRPAGGGPAGPSGWQGGG